MEERIELTEETLEEVTGGTNFNDIFDKPEDPHPYAPHMYIIR